MEVALSAEGDTGAEALARVAESVALAGSNSCSPSLAQRLVSPLLSADQPSQAVKILAVAQLVIILSVLLVSHKIDHVRSIHFSSEFLVSYLLYYMITLK